MRSKGNVLIMESNENNNMIVEITDNKALEIDIERSAFEPEGFVVVTRILMKVDEAWEPSNRTVINKKEAQFISKAMQKYGLLDGGHSAPLLIRKESSVTKPSSRVVIIPRKRQGGMGVSHLEVFFEKQETKRGSKIKVWEQKKRTFIYPEEAIPLHNTFLACGFVS